MADLAQEPAVLARPHLPESPVETALVRMRRYGLGERVLKSGIAAGVAWLLATLIHTDPQPVLAPITAMFTIQLTVARSISGSTQRLLGVGCGVSMAMVANRVIGVHWWVIALVVLVSLAAGLRLFNLEPAGVEQMTVSAMLVLIVGSGGNILGVAGYHILDTVIGTAVGLLANALIAPPNHLPRAQAAIHALGDRLSAVLGDIAFGLANGIDRDHASDVLRYARAVAAGLDEVQDALDSAEESLKYNLVRRRQEPAFNRYRRATRALEHAAVQVRVISRTISDGARATPPELAPRGWLGADGIGGPLALFFAAIAAYLDHFLAVVEEPVGQGDGHELLDEIAARRRDVNTAMAACVDDLMPDRWALLGEVVSIANQLVADLSEATLDLRRSPALAASAPRFVPRR